MTLDLRSDTLTLPTPAMRAAMFAAEVGDAYYDEDPSVRALERRVAALFGKEGALFMPSGTMCNQVAIRIHCRPGDAVVVPPSNHIVQYETGALAGINGVQHMDPGPALVAGFQIDPDLVGSCIEPFAATHAPHTRLVAVENTHLRSGGKIYPIESLERLASACRTHDVPLHIDGARIWNAHVATRTPLSAYGALCDTLSVCFSKGLGAPVGSCLIGSSSAIASAKRFRKMMGGHMRQSGFLAAAASFALDNHLERLADDHANAAHLALFLQKVLPEASVPTPATNIVLVHLPRDLGLSASNVLADLESSHGLRMSALDSHTLRAVLHLNISSDELKAHTAEPN